MASTASNMASTFSACGRSLALSSAPRPRSAVATGRWNSPPQIGQQLQAQVQGLAGMRAVAAPLKGLRALAPLVRCMATAAGASVPATAAPSRSISVGEKLPEAELSYFDQEGNIQVVKVSELTKGKKVVLFAVPGAFTPTCSQKHLPGFLEKADELRAKGVDTIACVSVNDTFVLRAWGESVGVGDKVLLLSDGNAVFTKALGVAVDLSDKPALLGIRSRRYALLADDGVVKVLNLEEGGAFTISGAEEILKAL